MKFIIASILITSVSALSIPERLDANVSIYDPIVGTNDGYTFTCQASGFFGVFPSSLELEICKKATDCEWNGRPISSHNKLWELFAKDCIKDCRCSATLTTATSTATLPTSSLFSSSSLDVFSITVSPLPTSIVNTSLFTKSSLTTFPLKSSSPVTSPSLSRFSTDKATSLELSTTAPLTQTTTLPTEISSVAL